ncbi:hypothetical protein E2C01_051262 [Portunus trituberculatus]|uniref:Uncharacterized protein n=1 Tax=Portunus trituberculatus TaxID=210409 RepID=A0A5B7GI71_PORTR|nr:hypothetical protein [Portunus trituberculatus]
MTWLAEGDDTHQQTPTFPLPCHDVLSSVRSLTIDSVHPTVLVFDGLVYITDVIRGGKVHIDPHLTE